MVDATSNMQAVAVEHRYGRPILPSFHGAWTFGGHHRRRAGAGRRAPAAVDHRPGRRGAARRPRRAVPRPRARRGARRGRAGRRPVAADPAGRARDGALLHGRHRRPDLGTDLPRRHVRRPGVAGRAGDAPLPASPAWRCGWPATAWWRGTARCWCCATGAVRRLAGPAGRRHRADLAGRGAGLHPARRRRLGDRAAQLLGRRPDRRRRARPRGGRGDRAVQPVQLRRRRCSAPCSPGWSAPGRCGSASRCRWC